MSELAQLRARRDAKAEEAAILNDKFPAHAAMPRAESDRLDGILREVESIDAQIRALMKNTADSVDAGRKGSPNTWTTPEGETVRVLRSADDIRSHYSALSRNSPMAANESFGLADFLRGVAGMKTTPGVKNALSVGTNSAGGYAVPSLIMPDILQALVPLSSLLTAGAGIVPLNDQAKTFTTAAINALPTAAWRAEGGSLSQSDPTFRAVVATPQSLAFYFKVSRELLADAPNLQAALTIAIAGAFAKELDRAGLRGSGTAPEPRGILNTSGIQSVTNGANGTALGSYANFLSAYSAIIAADAPAPTAAIMSPRSLVKLAGLLDTTNQPLQSPRLLEPMKMLATSQVPNNLTVGTSTDCSEIYVADFTAFLFMMREQMTIQLLTELFAATGEIGFACHVRADFALTYPAQFAVVTGVRP